MKYDFLLKDQDNKPVILSKITSKYTVLFFYPKDDTPGCSIEAKNFSQLKEQFEALGATVLGISGGTIQDKQSFCQKKQLTIQLLADEDYSVAKQFETYKKRSILGKSFHSVARTTIVLDKQKNICKRFDDVNPIGHAKEVLTYLQSLN